MQSTSERMGKGQISMEYLATFSIAAIMVLPLMIIFVMQSVNIQADITNTQAYKIGTTVEASAQEVYFMGKPAQKTITVQFPSGIKSVTFQDQQMIILVETAELTYNITKDFIFNVTGNVKANEGPHTIVLKAQETPLKETFINITD